MSENLWKTKEPLSNAEFRKLVETPVPRNNTKSKRRNFTKEERQPTYVKQTDIPPPTINKELNTNDEIIPEIKYRLQHTFKIIS